MVSDIRQEVLEKEMKQSLRKVIAQRSVEHCGLSVRLDCRAVRIKVRGYRYPQSH